MIQRAFLFPVLPALGLRLLAAECSYDFYQPQVQHVTIHEGRHLPGIPMLGKLCIGSFQPLENRGTMTSNDWN